jgi:hypothetical protein
MCLHVSTPFRPHTRQSLHPNCHLAISRYRRRQEERDDTEGREEEKKNKRRKAREGDDVYTGRTEEVGRKKRDKRVKRKRRGTENKNAEEEVSGNKDDK